MSAPVEAPKAKGIKKLLVGGRWIVVVGLVVLIGLGVALTRDFIRKARISQEINQLETDINDLERRNEELTGLIDYFNSDSFREREARSKLNVQKPGEKVVEVKEAEIEASIAEALPIEQKPEPTNNPARWWEYLFAEK